MIALLICCIYILIGIIFVAISDILEDGYATIIKVILFWPVIILTYIAFYLYFVAFHRD
jgi:hypothetical protein